MDGCTLRANENRPATSLLDSPNHLFVLTVSLPYSHQARLSFLVHSQPPSSSLLRKCITYKAESGRLMKVAPLSFASAFANIVFPHPG